MAGKPGAVKTPWQDWETEALKAAWPKGGLVAAQTVLPQRSKNSIKGKAGALRLRIAGRMPHRRQESSEWIDAAIKRAYRQPKPELKRLAREVDREVGWLKWRAGVLGVRRVAEQPWRRWTDAEIDLLRDGIERGYALSTLHRHLQKAGFQRSLSAVADRVGELQLGWNRPWYSASEVGKMLGIASKSVAQWIEKGWLKAERGVGIASEACADDLETRRLQYQITMPAVRKFLIQYPRVWDHRRVRIEVLLDLLIGGEHGLSSGVFGEAGHG